MTLDAVTRQPMFFFTNNNLINQNIARAFFLLSLSAPPVRPPPMRRLS